MNGIEEIPVPSQNGDSQNGTGLVAQLNVELLDYNREQLLDQIWRDKNGKEDLNAGFGMYVEIPANGQIFLNQFVYEYLNELKSNPDSFIWSKDFGRVVIGISDRKKESLKSFTLTQTKDDIAKSFKLVSGGILIHPQNIIIQSEEDKGSNLIVVNSQPTTIDGLLITLTHMLDQLVWQRGALLNNGKPSVRSYNQALEFILNEGVSIEFKETDTILTDFIQSQDTRMVRLYGSKNKSTPFVMGYVENFAFDQFVPLSEIKTFSEILENPEIPAVDNYDIIIGITTAKQIHMGHILMYLLAQSFAKIIDAKVTIAANNTGPRIAQAIIALQKQIKESTGEEISFEQARQILSNLSLEEVETFYRSRTECDTNDVAMQLLNKSEVVTLKSATEENLKKLNSIGLEPNLIYDTNLDFDQEFTERFIGTDGFIPEVGLGFSKLQSGQSLIYIENGLITATGIVLGNILSLYNQNQNGVLYVDGGQSTIQGTKLANETLDIPAFQMNGTGIGFGGEIASGTKGNSITVEQFENIAINIGKQLELPDERTFEIICNVLTLSIFSIPTISYEHPNAGGVESFCDFANVDGFIRFLLQETFNYLKLQSKIDDILQFIENGESSSKLLSGESIKEKELIGKISGIVNMKPSTVLQRLTQQKVLSIKSISKETFMRCGYDETKALEILEKIAKGEMFASIRIHPYADFLRLIENLGEQDLIKLKLEDKENLKQAILIIRKLFS